jgi:hypothetical protein
MQRSDHVWAMLQSRTSHAYLQVTNRHLPQLGMLLGFRLQALAHLDMMVRLLCLHGPTHSLPPNRKSVLSCNPSVKQCLAEGT